MEGFGRNRNGDPLTCARDECRKDAHPLDPYCSRLCHEVHIGLKTVDDIKAHERWSRTHAPGGPPKTGAKSVAENISGARAQGAAAWVHDGE
jgi:hypothetical protein